VEPCDSLDKFRRREIEQALVAELQTAKERARLATTDEERLATAKAVERALQRYTDFAARNIVPKEFIR
jgi:hypothetical protein